MPNVKDFELAKIVRDYSGDVTGRLTQIQLIAAANPKRSGYRAIALVCEMARDQLTKEWLSLLSVGVSLKPRECFEMSSILRDHQAPPIFLSIEMFKCGPVEPIVAANDKEQLIAWHSDWIRAHTGIILGFGAVVIALIADVALRERTQIEEMTPSKVVFLSRGLSGSRSRHGWARITIDLGVIEEDAVFLESYKRRES